MTEMWREGRPARGPHDLKNDTVVNFMGFLFALYTLDLELKKRAT